MDSNNQFNEDLKPLVSRDYVAEHISEIVQNNVVVFESSTKKCLRIATKIFAVLLGSCAGLPWVHSGALLAEKLSHPNLVYVFAVGVITSYGVASGWAFSEITEGLLRPVSELTRQMQSKGNIRKDILRHLVCHLFGSATVVPAIYLTIVYNTGDMAVPFTVLSSFLTYVFSTLGFYKLLDYTSNILTAVTNKGSQSKQAQFSSDIQQLVAYLDEDSACYVSLIQAEQSKSISAILQVFKASKTYHQQNKSSSHPSLEYTIKGIFLTTVPTLVAVFRVIVTYAALSKINKNKLLNVIGTIFVNAPLYALAQFAMLGLSNTVVNKVTWFKTRQSSSPQNGTHSKYTAVLFIAAVLSCVLSVASAMANGFVAEDQINHTIFSEISIFFGIATFLNAAAFQTIGCFDVAKKSIRYLSTCQTDEMSKKSYELRNDLGWLAQEIKTCEPNIFKNFNKNHPEFFLDSSDDDVPSNNDMDL